jgi:hypothetical protein
MDSFLFYINTLINLAKFIKAFIDNGYLRYIVFNEFMVRALKLLRIFVTASVAHIAKIHFLSLTVTTTQPQAYLLLNQTF